MPSTIHDFIPGDNVFYITDDSEPDAGLRVEMLKPRVQEATVESVGIFIDTNITIITYTVKNKTGDFQVTQALEPDTFGDLATALTEYAVRVNALA
ncbi:hypothetical protein LCGC14_1612310 [marine sediment metagenome]|uniref:Uncharacterized protein n=1 Tax=marine sediment metagenome TaxID=412755 RepID=A0A0F9IUM4_9ZZZZ